MIFVLLVVLPWLVYWFLQWLFGTFKPFPECDGSNCRPLYDPNTHQWHHQCDIDRNDQLPLTTCTSCLTIFNNDKHKTCNVGHCKQCGQRFRYDMPAIVSRLSFDYNLPLWKWCRICNVWHCIACDINLHSRKL
jgi:hypothetical protein